MLSDKARAIVDAAAKKGKVQPIFYDRHRGDTEAALYLEYARQAKELKATLEAVRSLLLEILVPWHDKECGKLNRYEPCVLWETKNGTLAAQFKNAYQKITADRAKDLRAELGKDFGIAFEERVSLDLADDVAKDQHKLGQMMDELIKLIGSQRFKAWFSPERVLVPTEEFTEARLLGREARERLGIVQVVALSERAAA